MHTNQKLGNIIAGRTIVSTAPGKNGKGEDVQTLVFGDGSTMTIKTASNSPIAAPAGKKVLKVRQQDTILALDLEDGGSIQVTLAEAGSSVMLRNKAGALEYAD